MSETDKMAKRAVIFGWFCACVFPVNGKKMKIKGSLKTGRFEPGKSISSMNYFSALY